MQLHAPRRGRRRGASAGPPARPRSVRALVPGGDSVAERGARDHRAACATRGDERACIELHAPLRHRRRRAARRCASAPTELDEAITQLPLELVAGLQVAIANVALVAEAGVGRRHAPSSCRRASASCCARCPSRSAAVYVPGGRAPYPSTVVMGVVTARAAGVIDVAVCAPPGPDGEIDP